MFWLGAAALVPGLFFGSLVPSSGLPEALACSGGAASEDEGPIGVTSLHQPRWPVAIDDSGFFAFSIGTHELDPDAALAAVTIEVQDRAKQRVAGEAILLDHQAGAPFEDDGVWIGWQAAEPLEVGDTLTFAATATNTDEKISMSGKLVVHGPVPAMGEPQASFQDWVETTLDTGERIDCGECTAFGVELRTRYHSLVEFAGSRPELNVAWRYSIEAIRGKGELVESRTVHVTSPLSSISDVGMEVDFEDEREEYCVRVVAHDLRSGEEFSSEACSSPERPLATSFRDQLMYCPFDAVPEALRTRYCSYSDNAEDERCAPYVDTGGGGAGGSDAGGASEEANGGAPPDRSSAQDEPHRKSKAGCSIDGVPEPESVLRGLTGLAFLALAFERRRRAG